MKEIKEFLNEKDRKRIDSIESYLHLMGYKLEEMSNDTVYIKFEVEIFEYCYVKHEDYITIEFQFKENKDIHSILYYTFSRKAGFIGGTSTNIEQLEKRIMELV